MQGHLHPSLRTFIDCFCSMPLPKVYPRGGGPHDQDPILMRDFRMIIKIKGQCQELEDAKRQAQEQFDGPTASSDDGGGSSLEDLITTLYEEHGVDVDI